MGDSSDNRAIVKAIGDNLKASRLSPEEIRENLEVLKDLRTTAKDRRVRVKAAELIEKRHQWQTEYEAPAVQRVDVDLSNRVMYYPDKLPEGYDDNSGAEHDGEPLRGADGAIEVDAEQDGESAGWAG